MGIYFFIKLNFYTILISLLVGIFPSLAQTNTEDFPLHEIGTVEKPKAVVLYITGDGGLNSFSKTLCKTLAGHGYYIVALDSKEYFWEPKNPDRLADDVAKIVKSIQSRLKIESWILIGYSFGADVGSFIPSHLSENTLAPVRCIYLTPSGSTDFEIKISDMITLSHKKRKYDVRIEIEKAKVPTLCLLQDSEISEHYAAPVKTEKLPGDHRFDNNFSLLTRKIVSFIEN